MSFTISNTGEGIPKTDRDRIFDRFYRVDKSRSREAGGVGLGLSLAREIVRAHKGDIVLVDEKEGWITFRMTLPSAPPAST